MGGTRVVSVRTDRTARTARPRGVVGLAVFLMVLGIVIPAGPAPADVPACGPAVDGAHQVGTAAQLTAVGSGGGEGPCGLGADYVQTANIALMSPHNPIGTVNDPFTGSYDGGGFTISGLNVSSMSGAVGFFEALDGARISDLTVEGAASTTNQSGRGGGLSAWVQGAGSTSIINVHSDVQVSARFAGGLVGVVAGSGSLAVEASSATGSVTADQQTNRSVTAGGLVAALEGSGTLDLVESLATGDVIAQGSGAEAGGLIGSVSSGRTAVIRSSAASGDVTASSGGFSYAGGLIGRAEGSLVSTDQAKALGDVEVSGDNDVHAGGLIGITRGTVDRSSAHGDVLASSTWSDGTTTVGGLIGRLGWDTSTDASLRRSSATGTAVGSGVGEIHAGGAIGETRGSTTRVADVSATGEVQIVGGPGAFHLGGLVGHHREGAIEDSYADVAVSRAVVGGSLVDEGGLFGSVQTGTATVQASFWNEERAAVATGVGGGIPDPSGVIAVNGTQLRLPSTFVSERWKIADGWVAPNGEVWGICDGVNDGRPFLRWEYAEDPCPSVAGGPQPDPEPQPDPVPGPGEVPGPQPSPGGDRLPAPGAGRFEATMGGEPAEVQVQGEQGALVVAGAGWQVLLSSQGRVLVGDEIGRLRLWSGRGLGYGVSGLEAGSIGALWLLSRTPQLLAQFTVDDQGEFTGVLDALPNDLSPCVHDLQVVGFDPQGRLIAVTVGVEVLAEPFPFGDVGVDAVHAAAIGCLADAGVVLGVGDGQYGPVGQVTRGQLASMMARLLDAETSGTLRFVDAQHSVHAGAIAAVAEAGIVLGYGDGRFGTSDPVRRGQLASMLARAAGLEPVPQGPFGDTAGSVHEGAINAVYAAGIARGVTRQAFDPDGLVRRDQMASFVTGLGRALDSSDA